MKRFQFKFQTLLNIELHREDAVKQELRTLLYNLQKEEEILSNLRTMYLEQQEELARKQIGQISPEELKLYEAYIFTLSNQITSQQVKVKECEAEADDVRQKLIKISKRRKMLEKLRERKKKEHEYLFQQYENKQLDELAITRVQRFKSARVSLNP
ncbi:MAG: flagellar export protein FliJ [Planctomycetes bacterium]|nr:flagellar export protein FliJ [Planctomycetota bacterium]